MLLPEIVRAVIVEQNPFLVANRVVPSGVVSLLDENSCPVRNCTIEDNGHTIPLHNRRVIHLDNKSRDVVGAFGGLQRAENECSRISFYLAFDMAYRNKLMSWTGF